MKKYSLLYILFGILGLSTAKAQEVSINVLSSPSTLPASTTGIVQVDICNTDPANVAVAANKLNPQISVGSDVTIIGATNLDGTPLTNFSVISNTGQVISLTNTVQIPNPECFSFKVIVQGVNVDAPGTVGAIAAVLNFQNSPTAGNLAFNDNSASSIAVTSGPDFTPIIFVQPSTVYGSSSISVVVDVYELNSVTTDAPVTVSIPKNAKLALNFDPAATSVGGRPVQNSSWRLDNSGPDFYRLTNTQPISGGGVSSFGLNGTLNPGSTSGLFTVNAVITGVTGELSVLNNLDIDKVEYFQQ